MKGTYLLIISGPLTVQKWASTSFAIALASNVFPVPGGPNNSTPLGGGIPSVSYINSKGLDLILGHCMKLKIHNHDNKIISILTLNY